MTLANLHLLACATRSRGLGLCSGICAQATYVRKDRFQ